MPRTLPLLACLLAPPALAQSSPPSAPMNPQPMPFIRATRSSFTLAATVTPTQYLITQPPGAKTYRFFQPCVQADQRIMSVAPLEPIVSVPTPYPGVRRVTSKTEVIDDASGIIFGAGSETLGSGSNPVPGTMDRIVSTMIVPKPGYSTAADIANLTCRGELHYGNSN